MWTNDSNEVISFLQDYRKVKDFINKQHNDCSFEFKFLEVLKEYHFKTFITRKDKNHLIVYLNHEDEVTFPITLENKSTFIKDKKITPILVGIFGYPKPFFERKDHSHE